MSTNDQSTRSPSADKFANVIVGDFVALPRAHGPSDRYKVTLVTRRQFVGQHTRLETFRRFRKLDGRSVGTPHDMRFAEPTYCETLACRRRLGGLCDACSKRLPSNDSGLKSAGSSLQSGTKGAE